MPDGTASHFCGGAAVLSIHSRLDGRTYSMRQVCTHFGEGAVGRIASHTGCEASHRPTAAIRQHS